ncbi:MAG TPA: hypothetical protein VFJ16_26180 [Longimicrobium sp.]|nr:hypothetical protein [Longimicrobium sp.]
MAETTSIHPIIGPAKAKDIQYRAFARDFGDGHVVLSAVATSSYPVGPYEIFFEGSVSDLRLMEKAPVIFYNLVTYQVASWTAGQPLADTPRQITITDGYGAHTVDVEAWAAVHNS